LNIFREFLSAIQIILGEAYPEAPADAVARVTVEPPRDSAHGDAATNAALLLAKPLGLKPQQIAALLVARLGIHPWVERAAPAGPGFVNVTFKADLLRGQLGTILAAGTTYGDSRALAGQRINVEYVSANPTGPMHIGHCRGAVVGDALALLLAKAGADVTREYYINDAGAQVEALSWAAYWRYLQAIGTTLSEEAFSSLVPGGLQYRGDYLVAVGTALAAAHGDALAGPGATAADPQRWMAIVRPFTVAAMMAEVREDLARLGIHHDVFTSEAMLVEDGAVAKALSELTQAGQIYEGVLEPPKGKVVEDFEPRVQKLFRATAFGDDIDRPLQKSDGSYTYFANDIAYHADKFSRGFATQIDVWGADHGGYVKRMQAAVKAITGGQATLEIVLCQIVRLLKSGEPYRMSKRAGTFVTLADLIEEVGRDVVRFMMLTRKSDAQMEFDIDKVQEQSKDNPVFYVQYAHARCRSVLRHSAIAAPESLADADLSPLSDDAEMSLIRALCAWPRVAESAALMREPHRVPYYLADVASLFHALWAKGRDDTALRFIQDDDAHGTRARLALVAATATVIASGLAVLGVTPVEEMR
jgi:arginyl-tRNA synthetase